MVENGNYSLSQNRNPILPAPSGREPATPSSLRKGDRLRWKEFKSRPLQGKVPDRAEGANSALCTLNRPRHPVTLISRPIQISILSQFLQKVSLSRHASCRLSTSPSAPVGRIHLFLRKREPPRHIRDTPPDRGNFLSGEPLRPFRQTPCVCHLPQ